VKIKEVFQMGSSSVLIQEVFGGMRKKITGILKGGLYEEGGKSMVGFTNGKN